MSPEAEKKVRRVGGLVAAGGTAALIASMLWQSGVFTAIASRLQVSTPSDSAIEQAISIADEHARDLVTREIAPVRVELRELTRQVDRMAGALEESNRRRIP